MHAACTRKHPEYKRAAIEYTSKSLAIDTALLQHVNKALFYAGEVPTSLKRKSLALQSKGTDTSHEAQILKACQNAKGLYLAMANQLLYRLMEPAKENMCSFMLQLSYVQDDFTLAIGVKRLDIYSNFAVQFCTSQAGWHRNKMCIDSPRFALQRRWTCTDTSNRKT